MVPKDHSVTGVLRINICDDVAPSEHSKDCFSDSGMNWRAISGVPNDECVIAANTSEVPVIRTESERKHTLQHPFKYCDWLACLVVP